jgi:hypothetical protein
VLVEFGELGKVMACCRANGFLAPELAKARGVKGWAADANAAKFIPRSTIIQQCSYSV